MELRRNHPISRSTPIGSKARLALDLLLYTGGRREDAVRLGSQHVRNGRIEFRQAKNGHRNPIDIDIPLHSELKATTLRDAVFNCQIWALPHLIICSPSESDGQSESHHAHRRQFPSVEYETSVKTLDSISYGRGIRSLRRLRVCPKTSGGITKFSQHEAD
jgi:hypothetical protein